MPLIYDKVPKNPQNPNDFSVYWLPLRKGWEDILELACLNVADRETHVQVYRDAPDDLARTHNSEADIDANIRWNPIFARRQKKSVYEHKWENNISG